ncbi:MAG: NAD(P)/FAD-dependent oxidoreductase, partial [Novosphingobium sp.]
FGGGVPPNAAQFEVMVVGAGISGVAAAIQLKRLGIPFRLYERNEGIGGTWWTNNYPDARVDTSSYLYQFKFEKNYPWSEFFAARDESLRYLNHVVDKYGVRDDMVFGMEMVDAQWLEERSRWKVTMQDRDGRKTVHEPHILISAAGLFNKPKRPDIAGLESFEGPIFHTTDWDTGLDVSGKRVALIGTGSTGAQLAPIVAEQAGQLDIYQRTPEWVMAFENYKVPIGPELRWLFDTIPYYWNWYCFSSHMTGQSMQGLQYHDRDWQAQGGIVSERNDRTRRVLEDYIVSKVGSVPGLAERLTPSHAPLVRRLVVDNGFYDALMRDNVELHSGTVDAITPEGIRSADGVERPYDVIVLGTGFETAEYLWPVQYVGRDGASIEEMWAKDGARSYMGITMPGFPNFFVFYGPNGSPRSGGFYSWAEIWARYIGQAIVGMIERGVGAIEVRREVFEAYNARMDEGMKNLIWEMGGASYYVNQHGRSGIFMPWETQEYHQMVEAVNFDDFHLDR